MNQKTLRNTQRPFREPHRETDTISQCATRYAPPPATLLFPLGAAAAAHPAQIAPARKMSGGRRCKSCILPMGVSTRYL